MKLRLQHNSIRFRLRQKEVARLIETGQIDETIVFGPKKSDTLTYSIETVDSALAPHAHFAGNSVTIHVSKAAARHWADGNEVGIEEHQPVSDQHCLHLIIEKDFACLDGTDAQNKDTFPHPLAGTKC